MKKMLQRAMGSNIARRIVEVTLALAAIWLLALLLEVAVPDSWLIAVSPWLVVGMVPTAVGFPLLYLTFYDWHRHPVGRALMTMAVGLALLICFSVYFFFIEGEYGWAPEVRFLVYLIVLCGLWYQFIVFIRIKREK